MLILFITLQVLLQYIVGLDLVSYKGLKIEITSLHHFDIERLQNNQNWEQLTKVWTSTSVNTSGKTSVSDMSVVCWWSIGDILVL